MKKCEVFEQIWNHFHCIGAVDGKHIFLQRPINSGSEFYNYKSQFSIVLFVSVDGDYNFLFADIGSQGRISGGGVFKDTELYKIWRWIVHYNCQNLRSFPNGHKKFLILLQLTVLSPLMKV